MSLFFLAAVFMCSNNGFMLFTIIFERAPAVQPHARQNAINRRAQAD